MEDEVGDGGTIGTVEGAGREMSTYTLINWQKTNMSLMVCPLIRSSISGKSITCQFFLILLFLSHSYLFWVEILGHQTASL